MSVASFDEVARQRLTALGDFIREQRQQAELSLRDVAARANVSNPYLSQLERGLHQPSARVLKAIASALDLSSEMLLVRAGLLDPASERAGAERSSGISSTEDAVAADDRLTPDQRTALLAVHKAYVEANRAKTGPGRTPARRAPQRPGDPAT